MAKLWTVEFTNRKSAVYTSAIEMKESRYDRKAIVTELTLDLKSKAIVSSEVI